MIQASDYGGNVKKIVISLCVAMILLLLSPGNSYATHRKADNGNLEDRVSQLEGQVSTIHEMVTSTMVERLEQQGHIVNKFGRFDVAIGSTGIIQGSIHNERNSPNGNSLSGSGSFDITITSAFAEHYVATARLEAGVYNGIDNTFTNPLLFGPVNGDDLATGRNLALSNAECFLEAKYFEEHLTFAAGLLDPGVFYDNNDIASDESSQFLNGGFVHNSSLELPQNYAVGGLAAVNFDIVKFSAGAFDGAANGTNMENNLFYIGELDVSPTINGYAQNFRIYGWGNHDNTQGAPLKFNTARTGFGFGASFDQQVLPWLHFFQRAGYARKLVYTTWLSFSGGTFISGSLYGRDDDGFGIAGGAAISNKSQVPRNEYVIEAYYKLGFGNGHVHVSPDFQFIINPAGQNNLRNAIFLGLRAQLDF